MKRNNTRLKTLLLISFIFSNILIFTLTEINKKQRVDLAVSVGIKNLQTQFNIINTFLKKEANAIYHATQSNPQVQKILLQLKNADKAKKADLRASLLKVLNQEYEYMKLRGVLQYHFVTPDGITFLRFHKPEKYGDYLGAIRYSFTNTNKTHQPTIGFEQGKTTHAFRNTYPIFAKDGTYLCALDIGYGSEIIQEYLNETSQLHTHFLVHKSIFSTKAWDRKWSKLKYRQSIEHEEYMFALTNDHSKESLTRRNRFFTPSHKKMIHKNMNSGKSFGFYFLQDEKAVVAAFLPIKNIQKTKVVAYLVSYKPNSFIDATLFANKIARSVMALLLAMLFYFLYRNIIAGRKVKEFNLVLEEKVRKRTHQLRCQRTKAENAAKEAKRIAITDRLTGLFNRLKLDEALKNELQRCQRNGHPFAVVMLDIDFFKDVNDTHGHQVGDRVLTGVAGILQKQVRETDIVGRWGGEEFLIICPSTELQGALSVAEKLRTKIEAHTFPKVGTKTVSFGVTVWCQDDTIEGIIARADQALYRAKDKGRNRVESSCCPG